MFKEDLSFLEPIFQHNDITDFDIIIVNQTTEDKFLTSENPKIKVINSLERGSPASRNLAIQNATKDICLMSDDDIVYQPNLRDTIVTAYQNFTDASMISFEAIDEEGKPYTTYYPEGRHSKDSLKRIYTWVITFRRLAFKDAQVYFNHYFGVGSVFKGVTEYVFLRNAYDKGLPMQHVAKTIVMHPNESSGRRMGGDNAIYARAAMHQRFYGNLSYLWLIKYIFFLVRCRFIGIGDIAYKFSVGIKGIKMYNTLKSQGKIDQLHEY
ncbi:glycosyltransferase family A protein [Psychroserpens luteolus]|uniref:glycosyltransferase family A protein n=1 Tax=Psychroserpens luteolus TaxID=2855840 RepID=UPI001E57E8CC|nr:glycosyltransferase family A protein [Psychroserpens luteolus]MCD2260094.1 glycosyltransferase family 2 protein [Psychroserpens luteolus]